MSGNIEYSFCPECGALMSGSVCSACGAARQEEENVIVQNTESVYMTGNLYAGNVVEQEKPKGKGKIPVLVWVLGGIVVLLLLLTVVFIIGAIIFIVFTTNKIQSTNHVTPSSSQQSFVSSEEEEAEEDTSEDEFDTSLNSVSVSKLEGYKKVDVSGADVQGYFDSADQYSDEVRMPLDMNVYYFDIFPYAHVNVPREDIMDLYYSSWGDSFDYSCGYSIEGHNVFYSDYVNTVNTVAYIGYYQLVGDQIPNVAELNKEMYEQAINPLIAQLEGKSKHSVTSDYTVYVEPFVTYNDEKKMSIIYLVYTFIDGYRDQVYLASQNIDLQEGRILSTKELIDLDESFAQEFYDRSVKQNGSYVEALEALSDAEIIDYLMDDETNILFFSPCGLEIGINYMQDASAWGWVTVTLREMGDVLIDDSYDFIKPAKSTWVAPNGEPYDLDEALKEYQDAYNEKNGLSDDYDDIFDEEFPEDDSDDGFVLPPEHEDAGDL